MHAARIDEANERGVHAHDPTGAETLQRPCHQQAVERPCERAAERSQGEQDQSAEIDALMADDLAQCAQRQQCRDQRYLVDVHNPDGLRGADMQFGRDRGQRDIGDCGIQRRHGQCGEDRGHRPAPALPGQAVSDRRRRDLGGISIDVHALLRNPRGPAGVRPLIEYPFITFAQPSPDTPMHEAHAIGCAGAFRPTSASPSFERLEKSSRLGLARPQTGRTA